ncbi:MULTISPECIES: metabolite traffic protein EboE [unclassified Amycolatopsis]|uniref:metabolite traffic protein EboE n=1 Tax=unclassified Amycolatopsis TaxID=2618356 RepID=UPI0028759071|nr:MULTISPECIES: metabolite traffic protein EboE [unclassified Amycolatopsis]MDS0136302.1 metabolite traffic protein EboE [Amycolatopsis sp. 505]MDS0145817.1 metabolite traffic protein EboE [Amycolatopsis sp. CM201R]
MRFRHRDGTLVHLAYCTNVHQAEDLDGVLAQLARFGEPVRERLGVARLGLGLWLARPVAAELAADPGAVARLRRELAARGLEVVTFNGFPYQGFHDPVVKHKVYRPDWAAPERTRYTLDLARLLAELMPDDAVRGSVSTLPLGWRTEWRGDDGQLDVLAKGLAAQDRPVRVAFEPEPGCIIETTAQAASLLSEVDKDRLGVCLDTCHLAVGFEDPAAALGRLEAAGLDVVKLQASAALEAPDPADPVTRTALASFVEPRFLHQSTEGAPPGADDLDLALAGALPGKQPWRVHFHVPLHADPAPPLRSTRPVLAATLAELFAGAAARTDHVEVETYTWQVLPDAPADDAGLVAGIAAELDWTRRELTTLGLEEVSA